MKLIIKSSKFLARKPVSMINEETAKKLSLHIGNRILIKSKGKSLISIVDRFLPSIKESEIIVSEDICKYSKLKNKNIGEIERVKRPLSIGYIKK